MFQFTLARDSLLVAFGASRKSDVTPLDFLPQSKPGARPSVFFAPTRDAQGLLTRKSFTHILLVKETTTDGCARAVLLPFPTNEWVADDLLEALIPSEHPVAVATCVARDSALEPQADVSSAVYEFECDEFEQSITVRIDSFVHCDTLKEQFTLEKVPTGYASFVVHWHQPEIGCSDLLQTTYVNLSSGSLVSYRHGQFFSVKCDQAERDVLPAFASCVQIQAGGCAVEDFSSALSRILTTLKQLGCGAQRAIRAQTLKQWQKWQTEPIATGTSEGIIVWPLNSNEKFTISTGWRSCLEDSLKVNSQSFESGLKDVRNSDSNWLKEVSSRRKVSLPDSAQALYLRSLLTLKQMQDPTGGIIAAPEFQFEFTACGGYGYCWGRDAGFISLAMDSVGMYDESAAFYRYMASCQSADGSFLHRHDMKGHLGPSWGLLQPDETGSVLFGLWQHVKLSGRKETAEELKNMVLRGAQWLSQSRFADTQWCAEGFDLWEEREGVHLYSVAAVIAGLRAAVSLAKELNWSVPDAVWTERANQLSKLLEENLIADKNSGETFFARTLFLKNLNRQDALSCVVNDVQRWSSDYVTDISLLGVVEPFEAVSPAYAAEVLPQLCREMRKVLWRPGVGGIGRYEGDHYRDGQPWILTTLWLALAAARCQENELAEESLAWVIAHTPREGQLPEQIDPATGEPAWVMPLTWSHAMFLLACVQLPSSTWTAALQKAAVLKKNHKTQS